MLIISLHHLHEATYFPVFVFVPTLIPFHLCFVSYSASVYSCLWFSFTLHWFLCVSSTAFVPCGFLVCSQFFFFVFFFTLWFILGFSFACLFAANFLVPCLSIACILNFGLGHCHKSFFFFLTRLPLCLSFGSFTPPAGLGNPSLDHLQETIKAMIWWFIHMPTIKAIFCFGEWVAGHPIKLCCNNVNSTTPTTVAKWCLVPISKHFWRDLRCVVSI